MSFPNLTKELSLGMTDGLILYDKYMWLVQAKYKGKYEGRQCKYILLQTTQTI